MYLREWEQRPSAGPGVPSWPPRRPLKVGGGGGERESEREIIISSCLRTELAIWMVDFLPRSMAKWDFLLFLSRFGFVSGEGKFSMCGLWSSSWPPRRLPKVRGVVFLLFGNRIG